MNFTAQQIANILEGTVEGDPNVKVTSFAKIEDGSINDLCFLSNEKYTNYIYTTNASVVIVNNSFKSRKQIKATLIKVKDSYSSFTQLLELYKDMTFNKVGLSSKADINTETSIGDDVFIDSFTIICQGVTIGKNVKIHANCYIGENVTISENTVIFPNVSIASFRGGGRSIMLSQLMPGETPEESYTTQYYLMENEPTKEQEIEAEKQFDLLEYVVREEDYSTGIKLQKSLKTGMIKNVMFGKNEGGGQCFHGWVDKILSTPDKKLPSLFD